MTESDRRTAIRPAFLALSCVGAFATAPAFADDGPLPAPTDDPQSRTDVIVNGVRHVEQPQPKQVAPLLDTPKSVIVLPREVIEQTGSATLAEALRTVPGITFGAAEGGNPVGDRPFIRGFDSQGSIYLDGVRDLASQSREVFAVDQVQIVRGSDSTLGGRGSAGGTINILSKLPVAETFVSASGSYGMADYKRISGDANWLISPTVGVRIEGVWHDQDVAGRDAIYQRRWGVAPSITIGLGTPTRLTASYYRLESHELPDSGIPYLYTIGNAPGTGEIHTRPALGEVTTANGRTGYVDRSTFYGLTDRDFRDATTEQATLRAEHDFGGVTLRNTARFSDSSQAYIFLLPDDSQGNVYNLGEVWRRGNTRYGYAKSLVDQLDLYGSFATGSIKHSFSVGAEVSWEKTRRGAFVESTGSTINPRCNADTIARYYCADLFNPNPNDPWANYTSDTSTTPTPIVKGPLESETQNDAETQALYGFDSITLTKGLILNLGARVDRFKSVVRLPYTDPAQALQISRTDTLFNWQAGLVFKPVSEVSLYASYATAATPPNSLLGEGREDNSLGTNQAAVDAVNDLKVQKTKSYEAGAKASLFHERLALGAVAFQTDIANARVTSDAGTTAFLGKTRIRGVELTANGVIVPGWTVFGGYTHLDPKIVDGGSTILTAPAVSVGGVVVQGPHTIAVTSVNTGKQVPQTARDSFTMWTTIEPIKRLSIGGGAFYQSKVYGGYADNRSATQDVNGVVTVNPATKTLYREVPAYWRFDARIGFKLNDHIDLSVNAQNLTDKEYFNQVYTSHYASIAPGRTIFGTVGVKF